MVGRRRGNGHAEKDRTRHAHPYLQQLGEVR
jgi:hypothetical protein